MSLKTIRHAVQQEIRRYEHRFQITVQKSEAFASFKSLDAIAAFLGDESGDTYVARDALLCAVVREHRAEPHPLWSGLLTLAFYPMLTSLRTRARSELNARDLDQVVLMAFLDAAGRATAKPGSMAPRLRSMTERALWKALGKEAQHDDDAPLNEAFERGGAKVGQSLATEDAVGDLLDATREAERANEGRVRATRRRGANAANDTKKATPRVA